jgi:16S rRNA U516 pseudouridylate synthase RsuA-like enzyme
MTVTYLQRRQEGELVLGDLPLGQVRLLSEEEITQLDEMTKK